MTSFAVRLMAVSCLCLLAACGPGKGAGAGAGPATPEGEESGYLTPPSVTLVAPGAGGALVISGKTQPGSRVQLALIPSREMQAVQADATGVWRAQTPMGGAVRLYAISAMAGGRTVQAEGYLALTPDGHGAQLRSGAGARALSPDSATPRILAIDYDRDGAAVVSGIARPGAGLAIRVDRVPGGDVKAGPDGRFSFPLGPPLRSGGHLIDVAGEGGVDAVQISISPPAGVGVFAGAPIRQGWRIDWTTPGGGAQTTLLLVRPGAGG